MQPPATRSSRSTCPFLLRAVDVDWNDRGPLRAIASASAGLSAMRRSRRNQTKVASLLNAQEPGSILEPLLASSVFFLPFLTSILWNGGAPRYAMGAICHTPIRFFRVFRTFRSRDFPLICSRRTACALGTNLPSPCLRGDIFFLPLLFPARSFGALPASDSGI